MMKKGLKNGNQGQIAKYYAARWKAHDASNDIITFLMLNRAKNYDDYRNAIKRFSCPDKT
jgi:penicillin amidase